MIVHTRKASFRKPSISQKKVPKTPIKRVNEKRVYPLFKAPLNAGIDSKGNIRLTWITFIPSTEAYVKRYFEDNAAPQSPDLSWSSLLGIKPIEKKE